MAIRKRTDHQGVKHGYHPRIRKNRIDYDYAHKLNQAELEFLGRFSWEYYGADFIINETFARKSEFIPILERRIADYEEKLANPKKKYDLNKIRKLLDDSKESLAEFSNKDEEYISIQHKDLRREKKTPLYYRTPDGGFSSASKYKYSDKNLHPKSDWNELRDRNNLMAVDMMSAGYDFTNSRDVEDMLVHEEHIENCDPARLFELMYDWSVERRREMKGVI